MRENVKRTEGARLFPDTGFLMEHETVKMKGDKFMLDLVIKNARIIDGTGSPWYRADLGVKDGKIAAIGRIDEDAQTVVHADDKYLAPGFIDIHSHSDDSILSCPSNESRLLQGITTELTGNCGDSIAPVGRYTVDPEHKYESVAEFLDAVEKVHPATNIGMLVGHGTVRDAVMGYSSEKASPQQIGEMRKITAKAMEEGAFGISSGLIYPPGCYADTEELTQVASAVAPYSGLYSTHMRNENIKVIDSVREAIEIAERSGARLQISHHKVTAKQFWQESCRTTIAMIEKARKRGVDAACDQYPYSASATGLQSNIPRWAFEGGFDAMVKRLEDPETRAKLRDQSNASHEGRWQDIYVAYVRTEKNQWMVGKSITEIAAALGGKDCAETCFDIVTDEQGHVGEVNFGMCEEDIEYIMSQPFTMTGTDGSAMPLDRPGKPHPRNYGTMIRMLSHYCRDRKLFSLETAIHKITALPASRMQLADRGVIKSGMWADLVLFDFDQLKDNPDYSDPQQACGGILQVYVNGVLSAENGAITGNRAGMALRHRTVL